jgi:hypothetical protein
MPQPPNSDDEEMKSRYSNCFRIGFNAYEFVFDFGQGHPPGKERIHTRIVTSPRVAASFSELLQESLLDYKNKCGSREGSKE